MVTTVMVRDKRKKRRNHQSAVHRSEEGASKSYNDMAAEKRGVEK